MLGAFGDIQGKKQANATGRPKVLPCMDLRIVRNVTIGTFDRMRLGFWHSAATSAGTRTGEQDRDP